MIPKIIHYINFGKLSDFRRDVCYQSILKHCPDYQIMHWDESTFDINMCQWTKQCYDNKDYRHLADYIRVWVLLKYGGIYIDTDVELIKPIDDLLNTDKNIVGLEKLRIFKINEDFQIIGEIIKNGRVAMGLLVGINPNNSNHILKKLLYEFETAENISDDVLMDYTNQLFVERGLVTESNNIQAIDEYLVYPPEYFCPVPWQDKRVRIKPRNFATTNTYAIHHYNCD